MFTALLRRYRRLAQQGENGVALITVLGLGAVLLALVATGLVAATGSTVKSGHDADWTAALDAAYAGVADYEARLTNDNTYQQYGNPQAPFSHSTGSTTLVPPTGANANPAFDYLPADPWSPVPGSPGNQAFRYEVDNSQYVNTGVIRLLATGRSGDVTRSVLANVRQRGFIDYMYFTDYEVMDPQLVKGATLAKCKKYYYEGRNDDDCGGAIQFASGETLNGPIDSNDAMYICGGNFLGPVTTNYDTSPYYRNCGKATFAKVPNHTNPYYNGKLTMPPTNQNMIQETRGDGVTPRPGCLYTGPTSITFNADGTMTVYSPFTKFSNFGVNAAGANTAIPNTAECGTPGAGGTANDAGQTGSLGKLPGATLKVPTQNLIYVQSEPASSADPNYTSATVTSAACTANGNPLVNPLGGTYPVSTTTQGPTSSTVGTSGGRNPKPTITYTYQTTNPETTSSINNVSYYGCRNGDAFVNGQVNGQVTVASDNFIYVTGDITYAPNPGNVLGLVGQNAVWVWNPIIGVTTTSQTCDWNVQTSTASNCKGVQISNPVNTNYAFTGSNKNRTIDAAMLSVAHTFQVQNYDSGTQLGKLNVLGAIAQEFRGPVGRPGSSGFSKNYNYDTRLRTIAPPKFLQAVSTTYGVTQYADVSAAYDAKGNAR
jgi:hypothetical protein